jgi:hypothetical protein
MSGLMQFFRGQCKTLRTALFVAAFLSGVAFGQSEVGQISGRVFDQNGAVIPGGVVKAKNLDNGIEREATTNSDGLYIITSLPPGLYEINIQCQGFAVRTRKVRIFVGSIVRFDPQMSVTPVTVDENIVENSGGVDINTQTAQLSDPVSGRLLNELPTITRDPYSLVTLSGNATPFAITPFAVANSPAIITAPDQAFAIDGQPPTTNSVHLDGGENIVNYWSTLGQRIPLAGVQELNVITNGFRPEYGRFLGGLIDVASRQGTSSWHGQVYTFYRGDALASNSFDNNARGLARGHLVGNQPGYGIGGPIIKDKLTFFSSTEGIIQRSRIDRVAFIPTDALLAASPGTATFFPPVGARPPITGPVLTVADTLALLGTTAAASPGPFAALGPAFPAFGTTVVNVNNDFGAGLPQDTLLTVNRFDYTLSNNSLIYGRYAYVDRDIYRGAFGFNPFAGYNTGVGEINHNAAINWMQSLGPLKCCPSPGTSTWVMNLKAQYERINLSRNVDTSTTVAPRLFLLGVPGAGFGGVSTAFPGDQPFDPGLNSTLTGPLNLGQVALDFIGGWGGNNLVRFGASYYYFQDNRFVNSFQNGLYELQGGVPAALDNFVLGTASSFSVAINPAASGAVPGGPITLPVTSPNFNRSVSEHDFALYFNDSWRITPRVNLVLGLRYDFFGAPKARNGAVFQNFFLGPGSTLPTQVSTGILATPNTVLPNGTIVNDRLVDRDTHNVAPRIGVAWDLSGGSASCCSGVTRRTTLRAGYGMTYERLFYAFSPFFQSTTSFGIPSVTAGTPGVPIGSIPVSPSNFGPFGGAAGVAPFAFTPLVRGIETNISTPRVHFWNVTLEKEISLNTVAALHYAGAAGRDLFTLSNVNRPGSAAAFLGSTDPTARLNPNFGPIFFLTSDGRSNYNAFIAEVTNSTWRTAGLSFTARYRFSKSLDNVSTIFGNNVGTFGNSFTPNLLSPFDPNFDYGRSDWDATHRFVGSFTWELPFDWFTQRCCNGATTQSGWQKLVFGGWALSGIVVAQSGLPFTPFNCTGALTAETPCPRAALAPGVVLDDVDRPSGGDAVASTTVPNFSNFLGTGIFAPTTATTALPPFPANTPGRNVFQGPNFWNFDFGVYKRFGITEDISVQLRSEFYNIFNHTNLFTPTAVDVGANPFVPAFRNGQRFIQFGARILF